MNVCGRTRFDIVLDMYTLDSASKAAVPSALGGLALEKLGFEVALVVGLDCSVIMRQGHSANQNLALLLVVVGSAVGVQTAVDLQRIGQISSQSLSVGPERWPAAAAALAAFAADFHSAC